MIGAPNDPSNEGRALRVLETQGLIKLQPEAGILATTQDITANPKNLVVKELDAAGASRFLIARVAFIQACGDPLARSVDHR